MRKKYLIIIPVLAIALSSCRRSEEVITSVETTTIISGEDTITKKKLYFDNKSMLYPSESKEYLDTYFFNNDIPYVSIEEYIDIIPYFDTKLTKSTDNTYVLSHDLNPKKLKVDDEKDEIIMYDFGFYNIDERQINNDDSYYDSLDLTFVEADEDIEHILDLSKYKLTIENLDGKILLPFHVVSNLFAADSYYYSYYTPTKYVGQALEEGVIEYSYGELPSSKEYLEYNYNVIDFVFSELYGLDKFFNYDISKMLSKYKNSFLNSGTSFDALNDFTVDLKDCHVGIYSNTDGYGAYSYNRISEREEKLISEYYDVIKYRRDTLSYTYTLSSDTAVVQLNEFNIEGTFSPIAIRDKLNKYKNEGYKNIIFDITTNGGGDTFALAYILGLMTNDDVVFTMTNLKNGHKAEEVFKVDVNGDGSFSDNDAYDNFNYYVLSSGYSYSCANEFVHYVKEKKLATVIGELTGGGACAISPFATPSGVLLQYSGLLAFIYDDNEITELGVEPDYYMSYEDMYDDEKLLSFINSLN